MEKLYKHKSWEKDGDKYYDFLPGIKQLPEEFRADDCDEIMDLKEATEIIAPHNLFFQCTETDGWKVYNDMDGLSFDHEYIAALNKETGEIFSGLDMAVSSDGSTIVFADSALYFVENSDNVEAYVPYVKVNITAAAHEILWTVGAPEHDIDESVC